MASIKGNAGKAQTAEKVESPARQRKVTAPVYAGAASSAKSAETNESLESYSKLSITGMILTKNNSLSYALSDLEGTLARLGVVEIPPCGGENKVAEANENALSAINGSVANVTKRGKDMLFDAIYGDSGCDECGDEEADIMPDGAIFSTNYGRNIFNDCKYTVQRLLSIQSMARRIRISFLGEEPAPDNRVEQVTDSVHACLHNLIEHINDTTILVTSVNDDLCSNLLGNN